MTEKFDLAVLGAGPGGYTAAFRAADLGLRVALIDRGETLGGVCLNVGCIPSKALLHAAHVVNSAAAMRAHGISFGAPVIDLDALRNWKSGVVGQLTKGLAGLARQRKVEVVRGTGCFIGPHSIEVRADDGTARTVEFASAVIAAGSEPVQLPGLPHEDPRVIDSTGALSLADIPARLLVIGGGIIGLEMATVYAALGSRVSVVELTPQLMFGTDPDLVKPLQKTLRGKLEAMYLETRVVEVKAEPEALRVLFDGKGAPAEMPYDRILVAVGRRPNGAAIGASALGLSVTDGGFIPVDRQMRTNVQHVFAIGDIVGPPMLAHKAVHEGKVAAEVIAGHKTALDTDLIPAVAYTDPEVAWVGLTETGARESGVSYEKGVFPWAASGRSLSLGRAEGLTKLLFEPETGRLLGAGIVGPSAGDLIAEAALAIEMGADADDLALTIHPHPTLSETVGMAAEMFNGSITDLIPPKRR